MAYLPLCRGVVHTSVPVAPVACQVILERGIDQFREFESPECILVHIRTRFFSCAQIDLRKARERELATLDEKSTSNGIGGLLNPMRDMNRRQEAVRARVRARPDAR